MPPQRRAHTWTEIFLVFLRLGCTSFGGPIAHLGYFQRELVDRRAWCSKETYAEIIALAQSLPGPASSQTGFALGLLRGGLPGALAAWLGFTLPSALLMFAFAFGHSLLSGPTALRALHGLVLVAVAIVAQAVISMQRSLAPNVTRILVAIAAAAITLFLPTPFATLSAIATGLLAGLVLCRTPDPSQSLQAPPSPISRTKGLIAATLFALLLIASELPARTSPATLVHLAAAFYRSGALVFGGGHVVLPLLENAVVSPGWLTQPTFLAGYGAAQALPGPLFTFGAYLGASIGIPAHHPVLYSLAAILGIFLPGLLLITAILPFWSTLRTRPALRSALRGINASVVGVLFAALMRPLATTALHSPADILFALTTLALLLFAKVPTWAVVLTGALLCVFIPPI
ncbi:MAG TPA: chromate efflux transporter [Acidobacteriaceae bacterium]|nr:chromate efflux transporter [Acidobacteriaceae bacterium]